MVVMTTTALASLIVLSPLVAAGGAAAQDAGVQVQDGQPKTKPSTAPQKDGRTPASSQVQLSLKLYDGGRDPFLIAQKRVARGVNAFDALRAVVNVDFTTFAPNLGSTPTFPGGPFVNALAGVPSASPRFWMLYVDGHLSDVGIGAIKIDRDILIEWRLEEPQGH
jgi:Domain of unknown function (DUF4430)